MRRLGLLGAGVAVCVLVAATGCRARPKNFDNENDELRRRVAQLERERDNAAARAGEAEAKLRELLLTRENVDEREALEALPRVAGITIGRLSGFAEINERGEALSVDVYIRPFDGRQRFVQVAGRITVEATLLDEGVNAASDGPRRLAVATLSPSAVREAYRASPMGTHYTVRLTMPEPINAERAGVLVRVELMDPIGGGVHRAERIVAPLPRRSSN
ncbi:MAG: hypothetical protein EA379_07090 [Phycisphaerales bacterium]|nr:MAG: hypothetical protein EA379_07090 [Phycisphaerales bacterium]